MFQKILLITSLIIGISAILLFITFFLFYPILPFPFKVACNSIKVGMDKEEVTKIMSKYINNKSYDFHENKSGMFWYTWKLFDDWQCNIYIENGKVTRAVGTYD